MTISELAQSINKPVYFVGPGDLQFACWVTDARISYGKPQFQIRPMAGTGSKWVEFSSIEPMSELGTDVRTRKDIDIHVAV